MEITWEAANEIASLMDAAGYRRAGLTTRAVFTEERVYDVLGALRAAGARLISVEPLQGSLEEYFLKHVDAPAEVTR